MYQTRRNKTTNTRETKITRDNDLQTFTEEIFVVNDFSAIKSRLFHDIRKGGLV